MATTEQHKPPRDARPPTAPPSKPSDARRSVGKPNGNELPRFDQDLRRAKNEGKQVLISLVMPLALDFNFQDEPVSIVQGHVLEVDTFSVKVKTTLPLNDREVWISKSQMGATQILETANANPS